MAGHCSDNSADRKLGSYWERQFCLMAAGLGKSFTPLQINHAGSIVAFAKHGNGWNKYTLPDVAIWTAPGEHHEIKHKNPTGNRMFGLEVYRFNALLWFARESEQSVMYTIHDHDRAGGRGVLVNDIGHWVTANILNLNNRWDYETRSPSYVNGERKENIPTYYWPISLWTSLADHWGIREQEMAA